MKMERTAIITLALTVLLGAPSQAKDLRIPLPKKAKPTPVQNYNREGVSALEKHDYTRAKRLFYKAYLLDPNDPFTLNNLGYVAELEGDVDRAQRFYNLSAAMNSDAAVDKATAEAAKGKHVTDVAGHFEEGTLEANRLNLEAISFLIKGRPYEAEKILNKALRSDPKNPFTLNNMGYDMELQGELQKAVEYYRQAADQRSDEKVIVAINKDWRGKPISEIAGNNASRVERGLEKSNTPEAQVALLNLRGVSALNRNDRKAAREFFRQAYEKDNNNAFALNNMGYLSELDGDRETAQMFYERARTAEQANRRVTISSDPHVEGKRLEAVANAEDQGIDQRLEIARAERRSRETGPVTLLNRGFSQQAPPPPEPTPVETAPEANPQQASPQSTAPATQTPQQPSPQAAPPQNQPKPPVQEVDPVPAPK